MEIPEREAEGGECQRLVPRGSRDGDVNCGVVATPPLAVILRSRSCDEGSPSCPNLHRSKAVLQPPQRLQHPRKKKGCRGCGRQPGKLCKSPPASQAADGAYFLMLING